jgi:urease accessory protein
MKAGVHIVTAPGLGRTVLQHLHCTAPFKVLNITEDRSQDPLHLMLMTSSPGILDRDQYALTITVAAGTRLQLHTQAYQRLFTMQQGAAQRMAVTVEEDAHFCFLPHPTVPHDQSVFTGYNRFLLGKNSTLIFGEILTCGRKLNGERFGLSKYQSITEVWRQDRLVIRENLLVQPDRSMPDGMGQMEGYSHQASLLWLSDAPDLAEARLRVQELLDTKTELASGVSATPINGLSVRLLGHGAEHLYDCLQEVQRLLTTLHHPVQQHD